ncbi:hypothetical protein QBC46DRAFT_460024 [Diplogelasinospora grovesii]|uniref:Rhodopsin domain-containing protein n=1 Tax=Diplogelasinospora grovesii TaxID=303347 RepID=A0AAN6N482_9PEZI|nr:hypothetical protein QBC46DRAFT_460024 [Diplogelasinospora grovesii]
MHHGLQLAIAMWAMTAISLGLVGLRLYTRIRIVKFVGLEDHLYVWTGLFLLIFTASIQVAVHYGLGQSFWTLAVDDSSNAIFWTYVANTFAITGNAMAKLSMGCFLLRVVQLRGQKVALWALIFITGATSIALAVMLWNQTTPRKASWDPLRTPGIWNLSIQPLSVGLGAWSSACDFFFAVFPWMFTWSLRMPRREKVMLSSGMSLGVIAGACGIIRTVVLSRLDISDYTLNFAIYFVWAGAEIAVAMVCLGIPTLRPLYLKKRGMSIGYGDRRHSQYGNDEDVLPQFEMCGPEPQPPLPPSEKPLSEPQREPQNPFNDPTTDSRRSSQETQYNQQMHPVRDSASSHTMVESIHDEEMGSDSPIFHSPILSTPESCHTHHSRRRSDSVDDILGLYDQRPSRETSRAPAHGIIWVKNEVRVQSEEKNDYLTPNWPLKS